MPGFRVSLLPVMNIPHELSLIIRHSHSVAEILDSAVRIIAREMQMDACSVYLVDPRDQRLHLLATEGLDKAALGKVTLALGEGLTGRVVSEMRSLAVEDASSHPGYLYFPETREERFRSFLGVPMALRNRRVGALVVQTIDRRSYSEEEIQTLSTIAAQLVGVVENARLIEALDEEEEGSRYLREVRRWHTLQQGSAEQSRSNVEFRGTPASPGIAMGEAAFRGSHDLSYDVQQMPFKGAEEERRWVEDALEKTRDDILKIQRSAEREADEEHALIFSSHLLLLNDPVVMQRIDQAIERGVSAPVAVYNALEEFGQRLVNLADPYIQDRVEDIRDLRGRILGHLLTPGAESPALSDRIVVCRGMPPSLVVELKAAGARALITEAGGTTSHGAILARSMGIPAVTGIPDIFATIRAGDHLIVDGGKGNLILNPSGKNIERYSDLQHRLARQRVEYLKYCSLPLRTADGVRINLLANIGVTADLSVAKENGADGVGLYRTEFPFLIREQFPTRAEQVRIYRKAYDFFPEGPISFRVLDLGGDKFLPKGALKGDRDPFRGYRSIRVLFDHPHVLRDQVQAFAIAAGTRPLSILIPMVSSLDDLRRMRDFIDDALRRLPVAGVQRDPKIGVMIEVPAAVEIAESLAAEVDYLSIGTNDLIQYALAVDRENPLVASEGNPHHPAILRMIRRTVMASHRQGKPVSVCGEIASRPRLALALIAMGIDALSVTPRFIPQLKQALASTKVKPLAQEVEGFLALPDADAVTAKLEAYAGPEDPLN